MTARAGLREWAGLGLLGAGSLLVSIDVFVLLLALPHLSADLGADATQQLWILDVYGFLIAGFLITMGTLGDRIGRRKLLLIGSGAFAAASVVAAFSTTPELLIVARAALGIAGATLAPSTLALIGGMFRDEQQRGFAIGVWLVCFMGGAVIGPVVGGWVLEHWWWGGAFLLAVPVMVLLLALGPVLLPEQRDPAPGRLDLASVALSLGAILPLFAGIKELAAHGVAVVPTSLVVAGIAVGIVFIRRQLRLEHPLLDLALFRHRAFATAVASMFGATVLGAIMFFVTQYLQLVAGFGPLEAGLWMLPAVACSIAGFLLAPLLARRIRPAPLIAGGLAVTVVGILLVATTAAPAVVLVGYALFQLGCGPLVTLSTGMVLSAAPPERAGAASAVNETSGEFGYAVGLATMGAIATAVYRTALGDRLDGLPAETADAVRESITGAVETLDDPALLAVAREAFLGGMQVVCGILVVIAAVIAIANLIVQRHVPPLAAGDAGGPEEGATLPA